MLIDYANHFRSSGPSERRLFMQIANGIFYVGVDDHDIDLF